MRDLLDEPFPLTAKRLPQLTSYNMPHSTITLALLAILLPPALAVVDLTVEAGATGTDVVLATISRLESASIFPSDRRLLRRIAYVETDDGRSSPSHGGIWSVNHALFQATKANESLAGKRADIIIITHTKIGAQQKKVYQ